MVAVSAKMPPEPYGGPYEPAHRYVLRYWRLLQVVWAPLSVAERL